jgi:nitroimidazol reductase NimA-like FMN-containing flavoprotein (pyridoxamine 5'-phosphate oxidase superfamily)
MSKSESDLRTLLNGQAVGVLATHRGGQPYTSIMAFAASQDLARIYFTTGTATRKAGNLEADPRAAFLIDNRSNDWQDLHECLAVTALGSVIRGEDSSKGRELLLNRHPAMDTYLRSPSFQIYCLQVRCFLIVDSFQHVVELHLTT